jgi:short-subunit dehydrogenase
MDLKGKKIVITGASCGIGYELAKCLLAEGAIVVGVSRNMQKNDTEHPNFYKLDMDVSSPEGVDKVFDYAIGKMGCVDIFVANAGYAFYQKLGAPDWERYHKAFDLNVFSALYGAQKMKQLYPESPYSVLITASAMGFISLPGYALYSATKAALRAFSDAYRYELGQDQKIQVVYPIATATDFFAAAGDIPISWPVQSASHVAKKMVKGLKRGKAHIHTSFVFVFFKLLTALCPPLVRLYNIRNYNAFKKWQEKQDNQA